MANINIQGLPVAIALTGDELVPIDQSGTTKRTTTAAIAELVLAPEGASAVLDEIGSTQGDTLYRGATEWAALAPGTAGQVLKTGGSAANPSWSTAREALTSDRTYYVRTAPANVTISIASPGVVSWASHGLSVGSAVVFAILANRRSATVTIATPAVVTLTAHGFSAGQPIKFRTNGALPTGITAGSTTYYVISAGLATDTFRFSATPGGSAVNTTGSQSGTHYVETTGTMPTGLTQGTIYYVISAGFTSNSFEVSATLNGSAINTSGSTEGQIVAQTGSDTNDGLTSTASGALLTVDRAAALISFLDLNGHTATANISHGFYRLPNGLYPGGVVGSHTGFDQATSTAILQGDDTAPWNVILDGSDAPLAFEAVVFRFDGWGISGVRIQGATRLLYSEMSQLNIGVLEWGTGSTGYALLSHDQACITVTGKQWFTGGSYSTGWGSERGSTLIAQAITVELLDTPSFSFCFAEADDVSLIRCRDNTFTGSATGRRYLSNRGGDISTNDDSETYLPGSTTGLRSQGGVYGTQYGPTIQDVEDAVTNSISDVSTWGHRSTGTVANSFGVRQNTRLQNAAGSLLNASAWEVVWSDATAGNATATHKVMTGGSLPSYGWAFKHNQLTLDTGLDAFDILVAEGDRTYLSCKKLFISTDSNNSIIFSTDSGVTNRMRIDVGVQIGVPTGGDKGAGTLNVATDVYKNNSAYTNPDYVFEHRFTGKIEQFADKSGAKDYAGLMALDQLGAHVKEHLRLPGVTDEPAGMFERSDKALEKIEELTLYILELHERIRALEAAQSGRPS